MSDSPITDDMNTLADALRESGEAVTADMIDKLVDAVTDTHGEEAMREEFERHRDAVYRYLDAIEKDDLFTAVLSIRSVDPAGVISIMGHLIRFWGDMLRGEDDDASEVTLGHMAKVTFDAIDAHSGCTCEEPTEDGESPA